MSVYREYKPLEEEDRFTFEDSEVLDALRQSDKLTERERLAIQRLYRTYQYMIDWLNSKRCINVKTEICYKSEIENTIKE